MVADVEGWPLAEKGVPEHVIFFHDKNVISNALSESWAWREEAEPVLLDDGLAGVKSAVSLQLCCDVALEL